MKRHESLVPLSREHHTALVEAKRLREFRDNRDSDALRGAVERLLDFWRADLQRHFQLEEEVLLPILARFTSADDKAIVDTLVQHVEVRRLLDELTEKAQAGGLIDAVRLAQLGELLSAHVRFEEGVLFPLMEEVIPPAHLARLRDALPVP